MTEYAIITKHVVSYFLFLLIQLPNTVLKGFKEAHILWFCNHYRRLDICFGLHGKNKNLTFVLDYLVKIKVKLFEY